MCVCKGVTGQEWRASEGELRVGLAVVVRSTLHIHAGTRGAEWSAIN